MRKRLARLILVTALTAAATLAADNSLGTWKLNLSKSRLPSSSTLKSQTDVREATPDGGVKITRTVELKDGTTSTYSIACKYDGKECPVTGVPYDHISFRRVDANSWTWEISKTGTKFHIAGRTTISKDGKTMESSSQGTNAEGRPLEAATTVFDKQ